MQQHVGEAIEDTDIIAPAEEPDHATQPTLADPALDLFALRPVAGKQYDEIWKRRCNPRAHVDKHEWALFLRQPKDSKNRWSMFGYPKLVAQTVDILIGRTFRCSRIEGARDDRDFCVRHPHPSRIVGT